MCEPLEAMPSRPRAVVRDVAAEHGLDVADLFVKSRKVQLVAARHDAWRRIRALPRRGGGYNGHRWSLTQIARWWGVHHATVFSALRTSRALSAAQPHA